MTTYFKSKSLQHNDFSEKYLLIFALVFVLLGGYVIFRTFAAPNPNLQGDLNGDNVVNISDLSVLLSNWNGSAANADINGDGVVSIFDLSVLLSHYGQTYTGGGVGGGDGTDIATEAQCPNQSNDKLPLNVKLTALICMVNYARKFDGNLQPLNQNQALMNAAAAKNNDMITCDNFAHDACNRGDWAYWFYFYGYPHTCIGENIAFFYANVRNVFMGWMNSPGHKDNILTSYYANIGVAETTAPNGNNYWTQDFGCSIN